MPDAQLGHECARDAAQARQQAVDRRLFVRPKPNDDERSPADTHEQAVVGVARRKRAGHGAARAQHAHDSIECEATFGRRRRRETTHDEDRVLRKW
jgi:hypothetical protein